MIFKNDRNYLLKTQIFDIMIHGLMDQAGLLTVKDVVDEIEQMFQRISFKKNQKKDETMDKKIKKIITDTKVVEKEGKSLLKADKKRDKVCEYGKKMMKKKGNQ
jgi:hypothetical protein